MGFNIAIDGPAGAGKSTIARAVAKELSFIYVDTGAMYRAVALYLMELGITAEQKDQISEKCQDAHVSIRYVDGEQQVWLNDRDVSSQIRKEEVGNMASVVSAVPAVRQHLFQLQRSLAAENNVVMDGRDIGTTILPDAQVKIFLTASVETRGKRRALELEAKGEKHSIEEICQNFLSYKDNKSINNGQGKVRNTLNISDSDKIYLIHDDSWFSRGKNGFAITDKGVYVADFGEKAEFMSWKEFRECEKVNIQGCCIRFDGKRVAYYTGGDRVRLQIEALFIAIHKYLNNRSLE